MYTSSQEDFESLVNEAIASLPKRYVDHLDNIAIIVEDEPSEEQRQALKLKGYQTLFGLYEGVPLNQRMGRLKLLPDKITIFKLPLEQASNSLQELRSRVSRTVWHEVAHYYGLNHTLIYDLESKEEK
ncbi:MAG TPA: metallopeptidase family protein [Candidatus Saccharimonadales bacterium]|nr:metallopeptidase family protein [Candidatus Saccharimonadales bacterium]